MAQTNASSKEVLLAAADDIHTFERAVKKAQFDKTLVVEVTKRFFEQLIEDPNTTYITYSKPGVKVYVEGTKAGIEAEERLDALEYREVKMKRAPAKEALK